LFNLYNFKKVQTLLMKKKLNKLSLKKVTILQFDAANKLYGGILGNAGYTTDIVGCPPVTGPEESCNQCLTLEATCAETCLCPQR
jgi:hypothetical protein